VKVAQAKERHEEEELAVILDTVAELGRLLLDQYSERDPRAAAGRLVLQRLYRRFERFKELRDLEEDSPAGENKERQEKEKPLSDLESETP
jgi:hypothetical protein